jgi:DNA-binding CsgD family transcriptional regulator/PAS domain-containing protein
MALKGVHMIEGRLLDRFSSTVDRIYAAAVDPSLWPAAVQSIAELHQSPKANLLTPITSPKDGGFIFPFGISESAIQLWANKYVSHDIWAKRVLERRLMNEGNVILGPELVTDEEFECSTFYQDFLKSLGIWHICTGIVFDGQQRRPPLTAISLFKGRDKAGYSALDRKLYGLVVNHLSRSLGTMFKLRDAELRLADTYASLDRTSSGVILLGENGSVIFANRAAIEILKAEDGLKPKTGSPLRGGFGGLTAAGSRDDQELQQEISNCIRFQVLNADHFSRGVHVRRPSGARSYVIQLSSLPRSNEFSRGEKAALAIVFITDPDRTPVLSRSVLESTFGMTAAECMLAQEILSGDSLERVAERLQVSVNTIKTQLQSIYQKTDTHRQAQLTKLLMQLAS